VNLLSYFTVHRATTEDSLLRLQRFRYEIYIEELGKQLPWADHRRRLLTDPDDLDAHHFYCATPFGAIVGCARLHVSPNIPSHVQTNLGLSAFLAEYPLPAGYISQLMFSRGLRGKGGAMKLLADIYLFGRSTGGGVCFNHCNPKLVRYYERIGLHKFGRPFLDPHVGTQIPMVQILEDEAHYQEIGSFLARHCKQFPNDAESVAYLRNWFLNTLAYSASEGPAVPANTSSVLQSSGSRTNPSGTPLFTQISSERLEFKYVDSP
jgi:predicted GNAT family N-acyltransferase